MMDSKSLNAILFEQVTWNSIIATDGCQLVALVGRPKRGCLGQVLGHIKYFEVWRVELSQRWAPRLLVEPDWDVVHVKLLVLCGDVRVCKLKLQP